jgi:glycosyltransferase involved in cell wall biosynthesis
LDELIEDKAALAELGLQSRRRVEQRFRWGEVADAYEKVLADLC